LTPAVRLTPTGLLVVVGGGAAVVLVVGAVLVSMFLAVAITAASVAVCAVVLRSMVNGTTGTARRR
jgi:membrane protein implicated in regulation of membrane protease activity